MRKVDELLGNLDRARREIEIAAELIKDFKENIYEFNDETEDSLQKYISMILMRAIGHLEAAEECTHYYWLRERGEEE